MSAIVAYVGARDAEQIVLEGLKRLEGRGYDSTDVAVLERGRISARRVVGMISEAVTLLEGQPFRGTIGVGRAGWTTYAEPSARSRILPLGASAEVVVVHNGIVENFLGLRDELAAEGVQFGSNTDTEVIAHLVQRYLSQGFNLAEAARRAIGHLRGSQSLVLMSPREPDKVVAARVGNAGGVVIGVGQDEMFVTSDIPAILEHTREMAFLGAGQLAVITRHGFTASNLEGKAVELPLQTVSWDPVSASKGEYKHFVQKDIHEQVRSITDTISDRVDFESARILLPELNLTPDLARRFSKMVITASGTAAHAGLVGKVLIERLARLPVEVSIASEFRYSEPLVDDTTVVLAISQSGETVDTLAAMEEARHRGAVVWSIVNVIGSQAMLAADGTITMRVGPEMGVGSTKAFTASLVDLYMLAVLLGDLRGELDVIQRRALVNDLRLMPDLVGRCLDRSADVELVARALKGMSDCLCMGRGLNMPIAYEGALKLKDISNIHAEPYAAGEIKHGPMALVDRDMPVIALAPRDPWYDKMLDLVKQTKTRGGVVVVVATDGDDVLPSLVDYVLWVPEAPWLLTPVVTTIPLQLLAYHIGVLRGFDVDQPRNVGARMRHAQDLIQLVDQGLPYRAFERIRTLLGLSASELTILLQIPRRTLTRRRRADRFAPDESERILRLSRVLEAAVELFEGDSQEAVKWLRTPNRATAGETPLEMARTEIGAREVENLIGRLEHGVPS